MSIPSIRARSGTGRRGAATALSVSDGTRPTVPARRFVASVHRVEAFLELGTRSDELVP